ncbi:MAG: (d)CMP kinase [Candidatus Omnitrophica bacterium]|nr:(d)CMP kinase [Candidatus Omnitrophota bacterium]
MIIAIDGPAGSGKTTVAKRLSAQLNISYLDTGATYRALTLKALTMGVNLEDEAALAHIAKTLNLRIEKEKIYLDDKDVRNEIRTPLIDKNISAIVAHASVREVMVDLQRRLAKNNDFVVEGRDITTVVFPGAEFKFYLDADFTVRSLRRFAELQQKNAGIGLEELSKDLQQRDDSDKNRKVGPLRLSPDATYIDTTHLNIDEVIATLVRLIQK